MALVNPYCSVQELRDQFGDDGSTLATSHLERAINATSRAIDQHCGRRFWLDAAVVARVYRPRDAHRVLINDIGDTTGLIVKTDTTGDGTFATTWDAEDYDLEPRNADVVASGDTGAPYSFSRIVAIDDKSFLVDSRRATLQITAKFGWSAVPDDVTEACILKAASLFKRREAPFGVAGFGDFGVVRIRKDPEVMDLLGPYVRIGRPEV